MNWFRRHTTDKAAPTDELYALQRFVTEHVFETKSKQLGVAFELQGIDPECLSEETLETYSQRLATAFRTLDEDFRLYQYLVKHDGVQIEREAHPNPVVRQTIDARAEHLEKRGLYTIKVYLVLILEAKSQRKNPGYLMTRARSFERSITDLLGLRLLDRAECFRFFRLLANLDHTLAGAERLRYDNYLDHWMSSAAVAPSWEGLAVDLKHVEILTLRELPRVTSPNLWKDFLPLRANYILCSEFKREPNEAVIGAVNSAQNHFKVVSILKNAGAIVGMAWSKMMGNTERQAKEDIVPDAAALETIEELKDTAKRINNHSDYAGQYSLTCVLHSSDPVALQGSVADAIKIVGNQEGSFVRETYNALRAYQSIIPGGHEHNRRYLWNHQRNYVDMGLFFAPRTGEARNRHLDAPALLTLETTSGTPYHFNLHEGDLLGVLLFGIMGSGKSFSTNLFIDSSQRYNPFTFILDVGGSYRQVTQKYGGSYLHLSLDNPAFRINPFTLPRTKDNLQFLFSFVRVLLTQRNFEPTAADDQALYEAVKTARRLSDLRLPEHLMVQLHAWIGDGQYAELFDNEEDTLTFSEFQTFDFQGMEVWPQVIEPLLFYIFQRISAIVYAPENRGRYKQLWADEVWRFLSNPTAKQYFVSAGKTWRKHNGGIGLITQSAGDLRNAGLLDLVNEICPTKILLANPGADKRFYQETFDMNDREVELFTNLTPKRQILVKTPQHSQVLNVEVDPAAKWLYANDPRSNALRDKAFEQHGFAEGLKVLAKGA